MTRTAPKTNTHLDFIAAASTLANRRIIHYLLQFVKLMLPMRLVVQLVPSLYLWNVKPPTRLLVPVTPLLKR